MKLILGIVALAAWQAACTALGLPIWACMIPVSTGLVWLGSYASLWMTEDAEKPMKDSDALKLPILMGVVLVGLFMAIKMLQPQYIDILVSGYVSLAAVICVASVVAVVGKEAGCVPENIIRPIATLPLVGEVSLLECVGLVLGAALTGTWYWTRHWALNNVLGAALSIMTIGTLRMGTYRTAALVLVALLVYDAVMVFGTPFMVTVASKLKVPIKLLFPRPDAELDAERPFSMLGLGDIVFPGLLVALLLRIDAHIALGDKVASLARHSSFAAPRFLWTLVGYAAGLATTVIVMVIFQHAQPALIYLVPAVLIVSALAITGTGKWSAALAFSDELFETECEAGKEAAAASDETAGSNAKPAQADVPADDAQAEEAKPSPASSPATARRRRARAEA